MFTVIFTNSCCDRFDGEPLALRNNSDNRIYYWYDAWDSFHLDDFIPYYHYPDTVLQIQIPQSLNKYISIGQNNSVIVSESDPNWQMIFSKLPTGKLSVYFFPILPETQEQWDSIRENRVYTRKDVTLEKLKENHYTISYP
jgi:hypothetical protein